MAVRDGERCLAFRNGCELRLLSRNRKPRDRKYPEVAAALRRQETAPFIADGEIVAFEDGVTSFARLQRRMQVERPSADLLRSVPIWLYLFDLLYLDRYDIREVPLRYRKEVLLDAFDFEDALRFTEHCEREGEAYYRAACRRGWEGVIAKNGDGPYVSRRTRDWLKFKCRREQELVIGGYTDPKGQRIGFGALLVGYYSGGKLVYAGKVGTGFDHDILQRLGRQLAALEVPAAGHYGAGTVMVWDRGGYRTKGGIAPAEQLARGKIDVDLQGRKLCGGFTLIRTRPRLADREWWLLVKHRDEHAEPSWNVENPELDYSVLTGRTLKEIQEAGC